MIDQIRLELKRVEDSEDVRVLFAAESGSRAWGFESPDSDWDVRFIYVRRKNWYLSIEPGRDVIERMLPHDIDLAGWDLPKALGLLCVKSNPALLEWLRSPIIYSQDDSFVARLRQFEKDFVRPEAGLYHYRSMALGNYRNYFGQPEVPLKKYLYCLRPILACRFIERTGEWPPMRFQDLVASEVADPGNPRRNRRVIERKDARWRAGDGASHVPILLRRPNRGNPKPPRRNRRYQAGKGWRGTA